MGKHQNLSLSEAAAYIGASQKAIRRYVAEGTLPATKKNSSLRVSLEDLEKFKVEYSKKQTEHQSSISKRKEDKVNWVDITDIWDTPTPSGMTFVDLFSGAGGLSKGLEMAGHEGICALDWFDEERRPATSRQSNWPCHPKIIHGVMKEKKETRKKTTCLYLSLSFSETNLQIQPFEI